MTMHPHGTTLIDAAVAKIVGLSGRIDDGNVFQTGMNTHDEWLNGSVRSTALDFPMEWNPSGDMRYAMEAAIKYGLFDDYVLGTIGRGRWAIVHGTEDDGVTSLAEIAFSHMLSFAAISVERTPELAICHAIIADHKKKNPTST